MNEGNNEDHEFGLAMPFWIDTDAYTDRDRQMFVCGAEFEAVYASLKAGKGWSNVPIHTENESRIRMMCGRLKIPCSLEPSGTDGWTYLEVPKTNPL